MRERGREGEKEEGKEREREEEGGRDGRGLKCSQMLMCMDTLPQLVVLLEGCG